MRTALITTTVNVPRVLELYRKLNPNVRMFVALDEETPEEAVNFLTYDLENTHCIFIQEQMKYECSGLLQFNNDSRRNIALLEALKWGAELIVSIDDDMIPTQSEFVPEDIFEFGFSGLMIGSSQRWTDVGMFTIPQASQRGLPVDTGMNSDWPTHVVDAKIGAWQGIILGVPDAGATTAIERATRVHSASDILRNGFVVHPQAYVVFNSQWTAFRRELAPAFAQFYNHQGRNTDIFASMLMRRVMQVRNLYTYYGPPMAFHARTPRPLFNDLKAEMYGLEHIAEYADYLRRAPLPDGSVVDQCRVLTEGCNIFSDENKEAAMAWYNDCESVL
jgi:hypothetical protein